MVYKIFLLTKFSGISSFYYCFETFDSTVDAIVTHYIAWSVSISNHSGT